MITESNTSKSNISNHHHHLNDDEVQKQQKSNTLRWFKVVIIAVGTVSLVAGCLLCLFAFTNYQAASKLLQLFSSVEEEIFLKEFRFPSFKECILKVSGDEKFFGYHNEGILLKSDEYFYYGGIAEKKNQKESQTKQQQRQMVVKRTNKKS